MNAKQWIIVSCSVIAVMFFGMCSFYLGFDEGDPAIEALASDAIFLNDEMNVLSNEALTGLENLNNQVEFVDYSLSSLDAENQTIIITIRFRTLEDFRSTPIFVGRIGSDASDAVQADYVAEGSWSDRYLYSAQLTIPVDDWSRLYYGAAPEYDGDNSPVILSIYPEQEIGDLATEEGAGS